MNISPPQVKRGSCTGFVHRVKSMHDISDQRTIERSRKYGVVRAALSSTGFMLPALRCDTGTGAAFPHDQTWSHRLALPIMPNGLQRLCRDGLCEKRLVAHQSRLVITRRVQRRDQSKSGPGTRRQSHHGLADAQATASQWLCDAPANTTARYGDGNGRDVSERGGKKASRIAIPPIHRGGTPTSAKATAPMTTTAPRLLAPLDARVGKCAWRSLRTPTSRRCINMSRRRHKLRRPVTPTNGAVTTTCHARMQRCVTPTTSGHGMMTAMASTKSIPIPARAVGLPCAIFCAPCAACIKRT
jgi:hypothetical protein